MKKIKRHAVLMALILAMLVSLCACGKTAPAFESRQALKDAIQGQWTMDKADLEYVEGDDSDGIWNFVFSSIYYSTESVTVDIDTENNIFTLHHIDSAGNAVSEDITYITGYNCRAGSIALSTGMRYHVEGTEEGLVLTNMANGHQYTLYR